MSVLSTPIVRGVSLDKFLSMTGRKHINSCADSSNSVDGKEQVMEIQKKVFQYIDDWVDSQKPQQQELNCDVEDVALNQLESHAALQEKFHEVKNVIRNGWMNHAMDIHQYDPDCEYDADVNAVICLFKWYMLECNNVQDVEVNMSTFGLRQILEALDSHFPASDAESLRYLICGRGLLKDNMDDSAGSYYAYLTSEECKSLLNAIVNIKQQYEREVMMGRVEEERPYCFAVGEDDYDPELTSDDFGGMEDEYGAYCESGSLKRKRRDTGSYHKKRRGNRTKFCKLSAQVEDAMSDLIRWLVTVTQRDMDLFMYVQNM